MRFCALAVLFFFAVQAFAADDQHVIADFEADADKVFEGGGGVIVQEHAKSGTHALKISQAGDGYPGLGFDQPAVLKKFAEFPIFKMDIFNPQDAPVRFSVTAGDAKSTNYGTRYNDDGCVARPGWSVLQLNLTGLTRSSSNNFLQREALDMKSLKFLKAFICPQGKGKSVVLYFDAPRLCGDGLPRVEGLRAFDFGPSTSAVFAGFQGVNEKTRYGPQTGFGWEGGVSRHRRPGNPDDLAGDYGCGDRFVADLPAGDYAVQLCTDTFGEWQGPQFFHKRTITINGKTVADETLDGAAFMRERYLRFEDDEDTPGMDLWDQRVKPCTPIRQFEATVAADGKLAVSVATTNRGPGEICFMVVYPKAKAAEGTAFMAALEKVRKEAFANDHPLNLPKPDNTPPKPTAAEEERGFIAFARIADIDINCNSAPDEKERGTPLTIAACQGERTSVQLGLLPLKNVDGLTLSVSALAGPNGANIPASAVTLRKVRNFAKNTTGASLIPYMLQPFDTLALKPGLTRGIWITVKIPADIPGGAYSGRVKLDAAGKSLDVPLALTVHPFQLEKVSDFTISCTGTTAGHWRGLYPDLDERWWQVAEDVFRNQAEHGMNAVTGGPGMNLNGIANGQADIDFSQADRWMDLANKYGLTQPGDAYQGFDVWGLPRSQEKDCIALNDSAARKKFNLGFSEALAAVYGAIEAHAKEKKWPVRSYYLLDEPRPEHGNVESARQLIELHVKHAPNTRFSGYYAPGAGRDPYFALMPVSIAHHTEASIAACVQNGKQAWTYTGGGARYDIGRWAFFARQKGLSGFLRNGYQYVNSTPYYDFSDVEGSWSQVWPSKHGIIDTINWERTSEGVNDFRYLYTLEKRIALAKKDGKDKAAIDAAETFLKETLKGVNIDHENSAALKPHEYAAFRAELARHILALK